MNTETKNRIENTIDELMYMHNKALPDVACYRVTADAAAFLQALLEEIAIMERKK